MAIPLSMLEMVYSISWTYCLSFLLICCCELKVLKRWRMLSELVYTKTLIFYFIALTWSTFSSDLS